MTFSFFPGINKLLPEEISSPGRSPPQGDHLPGELLFRATDKFCPLLHQASPRLEEIASAVGGLSAVGQCMGESRLGKIAVLAIFRGPVPEGGA